jgi:hypothetical protein
MLRNDAITWTNRLRLNLSFCLYTRTRPMGMGKNKRCHISIPSEQSSLEESGYGYPIIFIHEFGSDIRGLEREFNFFNVLKGDVCTGRSRKI